MDVNKEGGKTIFLQVMTNIPLPVIFLPHEKRIIFGVFERNEVLNSTKHTPEKLEKINLVLLTLRNGRRNGKGFLALDGPRQDCRKNVKLLLKINKVMDNIVSY